MKFGSRMERAVVFISARLPSPRSGAFLLGMAGVFIGLWWERPSLAMVVCGALLVSISLVAVFTARSAK